MSDIKNQEMRKWVKMWQNTSLVLKNLKRDELRSNDYYEKNIKILDEMLQYACNRGRVRLSSGLVKQQRIFMKLRKTENIPEKAT